MFPTSGHQSNHEGGHRKRLWTKSGLALSLWIGWILIGQLFPVRMLLNGYAVGSPEELRFSANRIAIAPVWWSSRVSAAIALMGAVLVVASYVLAVILEKFRYSWYLRTRDYRSAIVCMLAVGGVAYTVSCILGVVLALYGPAWQFGPGP